LSLEHTHSPRVPVKWYRLSAVQYSTAKLNRSIGTVEDTGSSLWSFSVVKRNVESRVVSHSFERQP
jgi:hypothetical protein